MRWRIATAATLVAAVFLAVFLFRLAKEAAADAEPMRMIHNYEQLASRYDWARSRANLEVIGDALTRYRRKQKVKPPKLRKSAADAALPWDLKSALKLHEEVWWTPRHNLPRAARTKTGSTLHVASSYGFAYLNLTRRRPPGERATWEDRAWSARGDDLPVLIDWNAYPTDALMAAGEEGAKIRCLVLRLSGRVDEIRATPGDIKTLMLRL